ncbi:maleylpyruvate isomerase family mycothiol-dependent enzyme [Streptomyces sp. So13.3]|uniref:maleylpyruvate isomerase family mycothiol-dependent enzyme n=1 Tax=Streptomyces sp. So13.3 TaxID=2136173 RepID=UPI00164EAA66|nr:maleylpyruvate isomerase family mycothiol-dependent enzyme [Streptomyces sp. So13.3]QNA76378.1 maleylpyruvate isomerase family mycothiol-dependent enzyme [Streptomyces sp. So13.3]
MPIAVAGSSCAERLLLTEQRDLIPVLRAAPVRWFAHPTACPGWNVRDLLAHCSAALTRITLDQVHDFSPECNQRDVTDRQDWPISRIIDELDHGYGTAGPVISNSAGQLDVIGLGEWVHAGDIRAAWDLTPAYAAAGTDDALELLARCSAQRNTPLLIAHLPDRDLELGTWLPDQQYVADLVTDAETLIRLYTGRPIAERPFVLSGATAQDLVIYR